MLGGKDGNNFRSGGPTEHSFFLRCWNIRRGLVKREHEITELLTSQKLDILFLVETDTKMIMEEKDYKIFGYRTFLPLREKTETKTLELHD